MSRAKRAKEQVEQQKHDGTMIALEQVVKTYEMGELEVVAVAGVDLTIKRGEFVAIVGPSGSGKTTLLNLIGCLDKPSSGSYHLAGQNVGAMRDRQLSRMRGREIGFVFQNYSLLQRDTALHNVQVPRYYAEGKGDRQRALALLERVGLAHRARHRPVELSGGEQQRVAIARALMNEPSLLLADEPTGNLDSKSGGSLMDLLTELNEDDGLTIVMVTHDPAVSARARRVVSMMDGRVQDDTGPDPMVA
ncbi:MAG: ABC transporter ATP-binding protein [Anaerolineae bacterium]|jgi:putative ABC transport system ATP-binding protein